MSRKTKTTLGAYAFLVVLVAMLGIAGSIEQAHAAKQKPKMGWICTGPNNTPVGGGRVHAVGAISCIRKPCKYVLKHRPWCPKTSPIKTIKSVFKKRWRAAVRVAWCESRFYPFAGGRGKYRGAYQMDAGKRAKYGHGSGLAKQSKAAHGASSGGRHWDAWQCLPA